MKAVQVTVSVNLNQDLEWQYKVTRLLNMHSVQDSVQTLCACPENRRFASAFTVSIQHNVVFAVDLCKLNNIWDIKCNNMGSWAN